MLKSNLSNQLHIFLKIINFISEQIKMHGLSNFRLYLRCFSFSFTYFTNVWSPKKKRKYFPLSLVDFSKTHKLRFKSPTNNWHTSWEITRFKYDLGRHISHHHAHNLTSDAYRIRDKIISLASLYPCNRFLVACYGTRSQSSFRPLCDS